MIVCFAAITRWRLFATMTSSSVAPIMFRRVTSRTMLVYWPRNRRFTARFLGSMARQRFLLRIWEVHVTAVCFLNRRHQEWCPAALREVYWVYCPALLESFRPLRQLS